MATKMKRDAPHVKRYREFYRMEIAAAWLYRELAKIANDRDAVTLERLASGEDEHARHWAAFLKKSSIEIPDYKRQPVRERTFAWIARRFGIDAVLPYLVRLEAADAGKYLTVSEAPKSMSEDEVEHGRTLATLGKGSPTRIADIEQRHRVGSGGALRAATFGVNDGLVSNLALVMGVAGGTSDSQIVMLAGIAGLLAGAFSMGAGEYISVKSQAELYEREIEIEREELNVFPEEERDELAMIYKHKGLDQAAADRLADQIMERPETALDTLAREELGLDPGDLGSPWVAAFSSFFAFSFGALVPLAPYLFSDGNRALTMSAIASGVVLALVGLSISLLTGRSGLVSASRMVLVGAMAAGVTYVIGNWVGATIT